MPDLFRRPTAAPLSSQRRLTSRLAVLLCFGSALVWSAQVTALDLDAVVAQALANNPDIRATLTEVRAAQARVVSESAGFDPRFELSSGVRLDHQPGVDPVDETRSSDIDAEFTASQLLPSGIDVGAGADVGQSRLRQRFSSGSGLDTQSDPVGNTANVRMFVDIPLGRGRGEEQTLFALNSAMRDVDAVAAEREQQIAEVVSAVIFAYWNYRAAQASLELAIDSEQRRRQFLGQIDRLIESDQRPASDRNLALASLTERVSERVSAEQALNATRIALAQLMDVPVNAVGAASSEFPQLPPDQVPAVADDTARIAENRADLRAVGIRLDDAMQALGSAELDQRPDLRLNLEGGFASRLDGGAATNLINPDRDYAGPNVSARIAYRWSHGERAVSARLAEREALLDATLLSLRGQRNAAHAAIDTSRAELTSAAQLVESAREAVTLFRRTVEDERVRYRLGVSTLIDLLELEDRLDSAIVASIATQRDYAQALSTWLFESAQLVRPLESSVTTGFEVALDPLLR